MSSEPPALEAGAFASVIELRSVQARLGEQRRQGAEARELWDAAADFVLRGRATGIVIDNEDERWTVQGLLDYWAAALERAGRPRPESSLVEFDPDLAPELADALCPYLGLSAFQETDSRVFFGRDALVDKVVRQLGEHRLVALVGPSGCGKSSLAFAGLASRLHKGVLADSESWRLVSMVPGAEPRTTLAGLLQGSTPSTEGTVPILVIVDQFEELFTLCKSEPERAGFVADLLALVTSTSAPHRVVLTVRSDFESFVARHPTLYELYAAGRVAVTPPSATELRQAIEGPAELVGLKFQAGVVDRLLGELLGEPAGLPLLQFTLLRLWEERRRNRVTTESYERVGGGRQALARAADAIYDAMIPQDQMTARRILVLVGLAVDDRHELTRTRVPRSQFFEAREDPGRVERVLDRLIRARLLRQTPDTQAAAPRVEVAHEALVRNWPRLAEWLQAAQTDLVKQRRLDARAGEWIEHGRGTTRLLDPIELPEAMHWMHSEAARQLGYSAELQELVAASQRAIARTERQRRGRLRAMQVVTVFSVVASILAIVARGGQHEAEQQDKETHRLLGMSYLEQGRGLLVDGHPLQALPYFLAARTEAIDGPVLRMLFAQAARNLPTVIFKGHRSVVNTAEFSSNGRWVVTASDDKTAQIWDASTGRPMRRSLQHRSNVQIASFSRDGKRVVTASADNTARVWDASTGEPITPPLQHRGNVQTAAFSPDGTLVVTASADNTALVWNAVTGALVAGPLMHEKMLWAAAFSPDGRRVVTASADKTAQVWDALTGTRVGPPLKHQGIVYDAVFNPDSTLVITASGDATAQVWNASTGARVMPALRHQDDVLVAFFSEHRHRIVTAGDDNAARIWDAATGNPLTPPLEHHGAVAKAKFNPEGTLVVTASDDDTARVWDASTGTPVTAPLEHAGRVLDVSVSPDGTQVVTASQDRTAQVWDVTQTTAPLRLKHDGAVHGATFSADGSCVVTASDDQMARVWDVSTGNPVTPPLQHHGPITAAGFSPDGSRVVTASDDATAQIWSASTGKLLTSLLGHERAVRTATFNRHGTRVVTASDDKTARIWDAATGQQRGPSLEHRGIVNAAVFSPDGARIVTASSDRTALIWDASTGKSLTPPLQHLGSVLSATFSPDGTRVVTTSKDETARIWDAATGKSVALLLGHQDDVTAAVFSPDGMRVVTASKDKTARVWDASTGVQLIELREHQGMVTTAVFSPDGTRVVTASKDNTARVWDASTGKQLTPPLRHQGEVNAAVFSPDGTRVVTASKDNTAQIWTFPIDNGTLEDWRRLAGCSPFALAGPVLSANSDQPTVCPRH